MTDQPPNPENTFGFLKLDVARVPLVVDSSGVREIFGELATLRLNDGPIAQMIVDIQPRLLHTSDRALLNALVSTLDETLQNSAEHFDVRFATSDRARRIDYLPLFLELLRRGATLPSSSDDAIALRYQDPDRREAIANTAVRMVVGGAASRRVRHLVSQIDEQLALPSQGRVSSYAACTREIAVDDSRGSFLPSTRVVPLGYALAHDFLHSEAADALFDVSSETLGTGMALWNDRVPSARATPTPRDFDFDLGARAGAYLLEQELVRPMLLVGGGLTATNIAVGARVDAALVDGATMATAVGAAVAATLKDAYARRVNAILANARLTRP